MKRYLLYGVAVLVFLIVGNAWARKGSQTESISPTNSPTLAPSSLSIVKPTLSPSPEPTPTPTPEPSLTTTPKPTVTPKATATPKPSPKATVTPSTSSNCDPNYSGCVPIASDVDCEGGSGNGPAYVKGPVNVIGNDKYGLDSDHDGIGCEQ
jgi:hypothetical protein